MNLIRPPQHWFPHALDTLLTLAAWLGFGYLLVSGIAQLLADASGHWEPKPWTQLLETLGSLLLYLLLSLAIGCALLIWAKCHQIQVRRYERRKGVPNIDHEHLSRSFRIHSGLLEFLHQHQILTVHNDQHGDLREVEHPANGLLLAAREPFLRVIEGGRLPLGDAELGKTGML